jgi:hypothetical protein
MLLTNCHLKHIIEGMIDRRIECREDDEKDVNNLMTLRKRKVSGHCKRKH